MPDVGNPMVTHLAWLGKCAEPRWCGVAATSRVLGCGSAGPCGPADFVVSCSTLPAPTVELVCWHVSGAKHVVTEKRMAVDTPWAAFAAGVKAVGPILLGVAPYALFSGVAGMQVGLPPHMVVGMSVLVFAGASQMAAFELLRVGAAASVIVLTAAIINLRFVMYSASIAPHLERASTRLKCLLAYLLTDHAYAVAISHYARVAEPRCKHWYFFGAALTFWLTWQLCTVAGVVLGAQVPANWSLDFAIPLTFLVLVVPAITDRATVAAAAVGGAAAVLGAGLPYNAGLITAALLGIIAGRSVEARTR